MINSRPPVVNSHFTTCPNPIVVPKCFTSSSRVAADFGGLGKPEPSAPEHTTREAKQTPATNRFSLSTFAGRMGSGDSQASDLPLRRNLCQQSEADNEPLAPQPS